MENAVVTNHLTQPFANRIEGRVLEEGARTGLDPGVRRAGDLLMEALHQARLADAGLADDSNDLAFTVKHAFPSTQQRTQFVLAADEGRQSTRRSHRFETPAHPARSNYAIESDRPLRFP